MPSGDSVYLLRSKPKDNSTDSSNSSSDAFQLTNEAKKHFFRNAISGNLTTNEWWQQTAANLRRTQDWPMGWGVGVGGGSIRPLLLTFEPEAYLFSLLRPTTRISDVESNGNRHLQALPWPPDPQDRQQRRSNSIGLYIDLWQNKSSLVVRFGCRYLCGKNRRL